MSITLTKGQKADLTKNNPHLKNIVIGMGWTDNPSLGIDFSAFLLHANGKVSKDEDLIFYSNPSNGNGSVTISSQSTAFNGKTDQQQVTILPSQIPLEIERIAFSLTIYDWEKTRQNFSLVDQTYIRIMDSDSGLVIMQYDLGKNFSVETAIVVGELYRHNGEWKFNAIGSGYAGGLAALCKSFGVEASEDTPVPVIVPSPMPILSPPPKPQETALPNNESSNKPINLSKIELKKRGDKINLQKSSGTLGEILVNLNWNQKKATGFFKKSGGIDLDLACLYELKDGTKGVVQALGDSFGILNRAPYIMLDGDDRTGGVTTGENIRINGSKVTEIKRILIFAFIYRGATNWAEADGVVTIKQHEGPEIVVRLDEPVNNKGMCAIAMISNVNDQTFSIEKLVHYCSDHPTLDKQYQWGLRWVAGSK